MNIFPAIFKMQLLKKAFYYFLAVLLLLTGTSILLVGLIDKPQLAFMRSFSNSWPLFGFLFAVAFVQGQITKKDLANLQNDSDAENFFERYLQFYKKRLLLNCIPVLISATLFVLTFKNAFFYILVLQIVLSGAFFPRQAQILKELPGREIMFS